MLIAARAARTRRGWCYSSSVSVYGNARSLPPTRGSGEPPHPLRGEQVRRGRILPRDSPAPTSPRRWSVIPTCRARPGTHQPLLRRRLAIHDAGGEGLVPEIYGDGEQPAISRTSMTSSTQRPAGRDRARRGRQGVQRRHGDEIDRQHAGAAVLDMYGLAGAEPHRRAGYRHGRAPGGRHHRIRKVLGWAPRVTLQEGLRRTQRWLSESQTQKIDRLRGITCRSRLQEKVENRSAKLGVVGLGMVGMAGGRAVRGPRVLGRRRGLRTDRVAVINDGRTPIGGEEPGLAEMLAGGGARGEAARHARTMVNSADIDIFTINVESAVDEHHRPNYSALEAACRSIGTGPEARRAELAIVESTVAPGTTERRCARLLEKASGPQGARRLLPGRLPGTGDAGQAAVQPARREPRLRRRHARDRRR